MFDDIVKKREINTSYIFSLYPCYLYSYKGKYLYLHLLRQFSNKVKKGSFKEIIIWFSFFCFSFTFLFFSLVFYISCAFFHLVYYSKYKEHFICKIIWRIIYLQNVLRDKFDLLSSCCCYSHVINCDCEIEEKKRKLWNINNNSWRFFLLYSHRMYQSVEDEVSELIQSIEFSGKTTTTTTTLFNISTFTPHHLLHHRKVGKIIADIIKGKLNFPQQNIENSSMFVFLDRHYYYTLWQCYFLSNILRQI